MAQHIHEVTQQELAPYLAQHPTARFRLIELTPDAEELTQDPLGMLSNPAQAPVFLRERSERNRGGTR